MSISNKKKFKIFCVALGRIPNVLNGLIKELAVKQRLDFNYLVCYNLNIEFNLEKIYGTIMRKDYRLGKDREES